MTNKSEYADPVLKGKGLSVQEPEVLPSEIPVKFTSIPKRDTDVVIAYLELMRNLKKDGSKNVPYTNLIDNTRYLFSGAGKYNDKLWVEHTATNLREMFDGLTFPEDYQRAIKNISRKEMDREDGLYSRIIKIKDFLDCIVHYRWKLAKNKAKSIIGDNGEDFDSKDIPDIHEPVCILLIFTFHELFSKYAFKEDEQA